MSTEVDRRTVLKASCAGCAAVVLSACGGSSSEEPAAEPSAAPPSAPPSAAASSAAGQGPIVALADLEVGRPVSAEGPGGEKLLLTRTGEATVVALSAVCTHEGCTVAPSGAELGCPCHGSRYAAATGEVLGGPAPSALPPFPVVVRDGGVHPA